MTVIRLAFPVQRRRLLQGALATALVTGSATHASAQRARALRFGSPMPADSTYQHAMQIFSDELAKLSSNKLKVELYPNAQLGGIKDMLTAVQLGTQSMLIAVPAWYSSFIRQMDVFALPFITASPERLRAALDGDLGQRMQTFANAAGFHLMGYWYAGPRNILNNVRPIHTPADVVGLKLRSISSPVFLETFKAMGANPVALDYSEVYLALQQHTVDGFDGSMVDVMTGKFYEVCKYASATGQVLDFFVAAMNKNLWDGFSPDQQAMIAQAMKTATDWQWQAHLAAIAVADKASSEKMQTNAITPEERAKFLDVCKPVYAEFEGSIGKDVIALATRELGPA
jgi:tripartite ATP-independent transporter DctP family solute receptor